MKPPSDASPESVDPQAAAPAPMSEPRPVYWSLRRELWENRSIYIAPLVVSGFALFGSLINSAIGLPRIMRTLSTLDPAKQHVVVFHPFSLAAAAIMFSTLLVGIFYSFDALYGERRDRSILFWKSLPVSDLTTVLTKASIPLVMLPLIAFVLCVATQATMLLSSTAVLMVNGISPAVLWAEFPFVQGPLVMIYGLTVHALWMSPIYGWLLLVSASVRRAPFLWALLPLVAVSVVERIAFNTSYVCDLMKYRVIGAMSVAFARSQRGDAGIIDRLSQLTPAKFLSTPDLWAGLALAVVFLAAAVRLRRYRDPI